MSMSLNIYIYTHDIYCYILTHHCTFHCTFVKSSTIVWSSSAVMNFVSFVPGSGEDGNDVGESIVLVDVEAIIIIIIMNQMGMRMGKWGVGGGGGSFQFYVINTKISYKMTDPKKGTKINIIIIIIIIVFNIIIIIMLPAM